MEKRKRKTISISEKEQALYQKIEEAKKELVSLQNKRKIEIGQLAFKSSINGLANEVLTAAFEEIARNHK